MSKIEFLTTGDCNCRVKSTKMGPSVPIASDLKRRKGLLSSALRTKSIDVRWHHPYITIPESLDPIINIFFHIIFQLDAPLIFQ